MGLGLRVTRRSGLDRCREENIEETENSTREETLGFENLNGEVDRRTTFGRVLILKGCMTVDWSVLYLWDFRATGH